MNPHNFASKLYTKNYISKIVRHLFYLPIFNEMCCLDKVNWLHKDLSHMLLRKRIGDVNQLQGWNVIQRRIQNCRSMIANPAGGVHSQLIKYVTWKAFIP